MRVNENGQYVSDDGFWVWDGAAWIPADGSAPSTPAEGAGQTSTEATAGSAGSAEQTPAAAYAATPAASEQTAQVDYASDTTSFADTGGYTDPGALSAADRVVPQVDNAHPMSPDGRHWWDGEKWIDVSTDATASQLADETPAATAVEPEPGPEPEPEPEVVTAAAAERQLSPDGLWEWNGTQWVPAEAQAGAEPVVEATPEPAKAQRQLSPDGHWEWDGTSWVPAAQEGVAAVPAGAHVSPDGHWWWDGSQWLPTGR